MDERKIIERDVEFDSVLILIRASEPADAAKILHAALRVAFSNGLVEANKHHSEIFDNALASLSSEQREKS